MTIPYDENSVEELLGAYALDALEDHERDLVDGFLAGNPMFRSEIAGHRETMGVVVQSLLRPEEAVAPPHVWKAITARLADAPPPLRLVASAAPAASPPPVRRLSWPTRLVGAVAAAAVIAVAVLGVRTVQQQGRIGDLETDRIGQAAAAALVDPAAEVLTLADPAGSAVGVRIALQPDGVGYVVADDLPALTPDRSYQLWAIVDGVVLSAGLLGPDPTVAPFQVTGTVAGFAITEEVAAGVVASENDPVAIWLRES